MKTPSTLKTTSALFSAALLLSVSGRADQNYNRTYSYSTPGYTSSPFGLSTTLGAHDDFTVPSSTTPGSYSVTATGSVTGKIQGQTFNAVNANGTARVMPDGSASISANLSVTGQTVMNVSNLNFGSYASTHFIKEVSANGTVPLEFGFCTVSYKARASVDACFQADAVFTPTTQGVPQVALSIGPVANVSASAGVSKTAGIPGLFSLSAGVSGNLSLGKIALKANATVIPTSTVIRTKNGDQRRIGAIVQANAIANITGLNGRLDGFAQAMLPFVGTQSVTQNIASYSSSQQSAVLLPTQTYRWF